MTSWQDVFFSYHKGGVIHNRLSRPADICIENGTSLRPPGPFRTSFTTPGVRRDYPSLSQLPQKASHSKKWPLHPPCICLSNATLIRHGLLTAAGFSRFTSIWEAAPLTPYISAESCRLPLARANILQPLPSAMYGMSTLIGRVV